MFDLEAVRKLYASMESRHAMARERLGRPITLAEKILFAHLADPEGQEYIRGKSYLMLHPDRVALQDATAQMAILQFMLAGRDEVAVPTTIHCDHLIRAQKGVGPDMKAALQENEEVFEFLRSAAARYGMGFWKPGSGIIHQVVIENYAFPGGLMIGTDSHTPNAGGLGMAAVGVGGADAVDVMVGMPWEVLAPKAIGVRLTGTLSGWTAPKDVILRVLEILTVAGGTNAIVEYFGPGAESLSCTGKATITNMGAELGATTSVFAYDKKMGDYLRATDRAAVAQLADRYPSFLMADPEVYAEPEKYFDQLIEIDLDTLEPRLVGPFTPDLGRPIGALKAEAAKEGYPVEVTAALIGSCTNSSYEDMGRAADVARQAAAVGIAPKIGLFVSPGSDRIFETIKRDGQMQVLLDAGATVLANACGPCIGQWKRDDIEKGAKNSIVTSFNRNFKSRNDSNPGTYAFIGSPEITTAFAFSGRLDFNPVTDTITTPSGMPFKFTAPKREELPARGFESGLANFLPPVAVSERQQVEVLIREGSDRLERLQPFAAWDGKDIGDLVVLLKAKGKCTTDHISPAGPWLKYRGHLANISRNMFLTAQNAFDGELGKGRDVLSGDVGVSYPDLGKRYRAAGQGWVVIGDENYGEGSSREHAAMEPRLMGCRAVIVRSFARIHETNLKKQGVLPLTFVDAADYDKVRLDDRLTLRLANMAPGQDVTLELSHRDGSKEAIMLRHTFNAEQVVWFRLGSALNVIRANRAALA